MKVEQYVMAYQAEQDRLRALLPEGFESLRPVLRINAEIRSGERDSLYLEYNTPVAAFGKRGWLNIANWETPSAEIVCQKEGQTTAFDSPFLRIAFTRAGIAGGCPAERDNDGCFFPDRAMTFRPAEPISANREFCSCEFAWKFNGGSARGKSADAKSLPALPSAPQTRYAREVLSARNAAAIPCGQILGAYVVAFERMG